MLSTTLRQSLYKFQTNLTRTYGCGEKITENFVARASITRSVRSRWGVRFLTTPTAEAKPFSEIPGPRRLPFVGSALAVLSELRKNKPIYQLQQEWMMKYGTVYRVKIPTIPEMVMIYDPKDVETMFRAEGMYPSRIPFQAIRQARKELKIEMAVLLSEGEEWHRQRVPMSKFAMVPQNVAKFHEEFNAIVVDLLTKIQRQKDPNTQVLSDVPNLLNKWSFESVCYFVLGKRMGCLGDQVPQDCKDLIVAVHEMFNSIQSLLSGPPLHIVWSTKQWKFLKKTVKQLNELALNHVREKLEKIRKENQNGTLEGSEIPDKVDFLTYIMYSGKQSLKEGAANAVDLMTGGIDSTSYTLAWCLYNLGRNLEAQEKLRSEVQSVVGSDEMVTPAHIHRMPYLRDCFKESHRLHPIAGGNSRFIQEDVILSGYKVPAGSLVGTSGYVSGRVPHIFPEPECFIPERWSRENEEKPPTFSSLPFGFGPRMCVGRRVAELVLHIAMAHIMRNFRVEYPESTPVGIKQMIVLTPDRPLNLTFMNL